MGTVMGVECVHCGTAIDGWRHIMLRSSAWDVAVQHRFCTWYCVVNYALEQALDEASEITVSDIQGAMPADIAVRIEQYLADPQNIRAPRVQPKRAGNDG